MTKRWNGLVGLRAGSVARAEDLYTACVRECARHLAARGEAGTRADAALIAAIGALVAEHTELRPDEDAVFEALLTVGAAALAAGEPRLARRVADSTVALRSRSAAAWELRGRVLRAAGRETEAVEALGRGLSLRRRVAA
ncbi:hypothetical protein [Streptomyces lonarensis]|uniref:Tetratricopeptide repeat protein n=1 Tax=Streptomyces lonarensis TaxID=700599 RepID=A0A7X6I181_9ACTN|nr:hypothetical protein [Streptomyces lonarensis]NJQ08280.1 hypothetical protein [Streptomyces lonarensis]